MSENAVPAMLMVGILLIIFILLAACAIIAFMYLSAAPEGGAVTPQGGGQSGTGNTSDGSGAIDHNTTSINISGDDMALWDSISVKNVETACLIKAKEEAGSSASMVYACECVEEATALSKNYECSIDTADPFTEYFAEIGCSLEKRACIVETNYGTANVSFSELRDYFSD